MMPRKRRHDLREFWPWYERHWETAKGETGETANPPPFELSDLHEKPLLSKRERTVAQVLCIVVAALLFALVMWGIFH
jgi:hypothetical protein